jgi:uncharacterized protein YceH (UPF0502 family)
MMTAAPAGARSASNERIDALEQRVSELEAALDDLRRQLGV